MKTKNLLMLFALAGMIIFASCKKDDDPSPLSKDEATTLLTSTNSDFADVYAEYNASDAGQMQAFLDSYSLPISVPMKSPASAKQFKEDVKKAASSSRIKAKGDGGPFIYIDWTNSVGTWTWNTSTSSWDHTSTPANKIVIVFPYSDGTATLTYDNYATKTFTYDTETIIYVSSLNFKAEYTASGTTTTVFSWAYTASRTDYDKGSVTFSYTLGDFSQTESYSSTYSTDYTTYYKMSQSMSFEVKYMGEIVFGQYAAISANESQDGYSVSIDARVRVKSIVVKWDIDWTNTTDTSDPNNFMKISVWRTDGAKIADVEMIYDSELDDYVAWFVYTDGTKEKVSDKLGSENEEGSIYGMMYWFINDLMYMNNK